MVGGGPVGRQWVEVPRIPPSCFPVRTVQMRGCPRWCRVGPSVFIVSCQTFVLTFELVTQCVFSTIEPCCPVLLCLCLVISKSLYRTYILYNLWAACSFQVFKRHLMKYLILIQSTFGRLELYEKEVQISSQETQLQPVSPNPWSCHWLVQLWGKGKVIQHA